MAKQLRRFLWILATVPIMLVAFCVGLVAMGCLLLGVVGAGLASLVKDGLVKWASLAPVLALLATVGCATAPTRAESFEYWTRYYEARMGLQEGPIVLGKPPDGFRCGQVKLHPWIVSGGVKPLPTTFYDPEAKSCPSPWTVALHEACHRRMMHHLLTWSDVREMGIDIEAEARECMTWYAED